MNLNFKRDQMTQTNVPDLNKMIERSWLMEISAELEMIETIDRSHRV
jgi:hypothetical protein